MKCSYFVFSLLGLFIQTAYAETNKPTILYSFNGFYEQYQESLLNYKDNILYGSSSTGIYEKNLSDSSQTIKYLTTTFSDANISFAHDKENLYGTYNDFDRGGIVKFDYEGTYKFLHLFSIDKHFDEGYDAIGNLIQTKDKTIYGITESGGVIHARSDSGVVYQLKDDGTYSVIHAFTGMEDGMRPMAGLVMSSDEKYIYGATIHGKQNYCGALFRVDVSVKEPKFEVLRSLNCDDTAPRFNSLIINHDNTKLYGTTEGMYGTVVEVDLTKPTYPITVLHTFKHEADDGVNPMAIVLDTSGKTMYGVTYGGQDKWHFHFGTIFKIQLDDQLAFTTLVRGEDQLMERPKVLRITSDNKTLYGLSDFDGEHRSGSIFKFELGAV